MACWIIGRKTFLPMNSNLSESRLPMSPSVDLDAKDPAMTMR